MLDKQPLLTKALTSLTGFSVGDILAQCFTQSRDVVCGATSDVRLCDPNKTVLYHCYPENVYNTSLQSEKSTRKLLKFPRRGVNVTGMTHDPSGDLTFRQEISRDGW